MVTIYHMKKMVITYCNGDQELCTYSGEDVNDSLNNLVNKSFNDVWYAKDIFGDFKLITNMKYVRSIEIIDDDGSI